MFEVMKNSLVFEYFDSILGESFHNVDVVDALRSNVTIRFELNEGSRIVFNP